MIAAKLARVSAPLGWGAGGIMRAGRVPRGRPGPEFFS